MAASERGEGSDRDRGFARRRRSWAPLPLLLALLLLPGRPALGNQGAAAGSCRCERHEREPPLVTRFPHRLVSWERCPGLIRFNFPKSQVCGLEKAPWALRLAALNPEKGRGAARASPTGRTPLQPLSSVGPALGVPRETLPSQPVPRETSAATTAAPTLESLRSVVLPRNGAIAEGGPSQPAPEEGVPAGRYQTTVLSALGIVLLLVIVGLLCWWRPPRRWHRAALPSEQKAWRLARPGEA